MYEKQSNKLSIIIAVISIALLLGGIYLINRTFTADKQSDSSTSASSLAVSISSSGNNVLTNAPTTRSSNSDTSTSSSISDASNVTPSSSATSISSSSSQSASSSNSADSSNLKSNEVTAKVIATNSDGSYKFEIIDCGIPNATVCKKGARLNLITTGLGSIKEEVNYKITGDFKEEDGKIIVDSINSITQN